MDEWQFYALLRYEEAAMALRVALRLGIVDQLGTEQWSTEELHEKFEFTAQGGRTFCHLLHVMGILEKSDSKFKVTPSAATCLCDGHTESRKPYLAMGGSEQADSIIALLQGKNPESSLPLYGTETGGQTVMDEEPIAREIAIGLASRARNFASPLANCMASNNLNAKTIADIGAGSPYVASACLERFDNLEKITLVDRANGMRFAREIAEAEGIKDERIEYCETDFFDSVPSADLYVLSNTAHDWLVEEYAQIIDNIGKVISPGGTIVVHEPVLVTSWKSAEEWMRALWMACYALTLFRLTLGKGTCYTVHEHQKILGGYGYNLVGHPNPTSDGCTAMLFQKS